ncbi:MAG: hypothetical protein IJB02_03350 [Oscillospiraceae bacterium]|nr:hypothetical protein [Oscillospiraceae bacterium]
MIMTIYSRALKVLLKKPLKLWGLSLLSVALSGLFSALCGVAIPALGIGVSLLMTTSMTMVYLYGYRGEEVKAVQLFSCFKDWNTIKRVLCGMGWMALWIFLWGLIPIVGPIFAMIRSYEYRLTPYILVTEPEVSVTDAIKVSSARTKGYKGKMFLADFLYGVFFGLTCFVLGLFAAIPYIGVLFGIALFVAYIAYIALSPLFLGLVQAAFYEEITNPTIVNNVVVVGSCANCGAPLAAGAKFCASCGKSVEE